MQKCHENSSNWNTEDYILLLKYSLMQSITPVDQCLYS
jgi:hypothetical protein